MLIRLMAALLLLAIVAAGAAYLYLRQSLPQMSGEIAVAGVAGPVDIVRDADAIPHIFASTKADALFGLGYVHAQDRLWQMEFQRRIGHGRLSEDLRRGDDSSGSVPPHGRVRPRGALGVGSPPEDARQQIDAYVAGVNAFITTHHGRLLPPEFTLLRFEPEPFTGPDVLVWVKMMAWDLSANYTLELMRHDIAAKVGAERMAELLPPYPRRRLEHRRRVARAGPGASAGGERTQTCSADLQVGR